MTITEFLRTQVPFLAGLTAEQAHELAGACEQKSFAAGKTIVFAGTTIDGLHVVAEGKVGVWVKPEKQKTTVQAAVLGPGEVFGETSILESGTAGATIRALEDGAVVFVIPQDAFQRILAGNAELQARAQALIDSRKKRTLS